jgi:hypothetical protein
LLLESSRHLGRWLTCHELILTSAELIKLVRAKLAGLLHAWLLIHHSRVRHESSLTCELLHHLLLHHLLLEDHLLMHRNLLHHLQLRVEWVRLETRRRRLGLLGLGCLLLLLQLNGIKIERIKLRGFFCFG